MKISLKNYSKEIDEGYILKVNAQYFQKLDELQNHLSILAEMMKIEKEEKLIANLRDKSEYVIHIRYSKTH